MELTSKQQAYLRGLAHKLNPAVQSGKAGVTPALLKEVERNLKDHELIKVKLSCDDREEFLALVDHLATTTASTLVQIIGRTIVLYREGEDPEITLPSAKPGKAVKTLKAGKADRPGKAGKPAKKTARA